LKHIDLINQFREEIALLVREVETSVAMGHFDINKICENVVLGLFRELFGFAELRNLNEEEKQNFPGIDLADDNARVAIQVTSERSLDKVKDTLQKVVNHKLYTMYDRVIIYVLTNKQQSYSSTAIDKICGKKLSFSVRSDILDHKDVASKAATAVPKQLKAATEILLAYNRGVEIGLADQDFDPPVEPAEVLGTNLIEFYFPATLYIAELLPEVLQTRSGQKVKNHRKGVKEYTRKERQPVPSDFEASGAKLITFHDLENGNCPFRYLIDEGTVEAFNPREFYEIDEDHERVFKSLLRFTLQQKLFKQDVMWQHEERMFIFLPSKDGQRKRSETWTGQKSASRMVFERKFKRDKPDEILSTRHLAFSADFLQLDDRWFISLTPDWFFSYGDDYRRSFYGDKLLSGLKRMEKNRSVYNQFRFLASWLEEIDKEDLFSESMVDTPSLSFAAPLRLLGGRALDEKLWEPLRVDVDDEVQDMLDRL
jgi:hypothetical protein